MRLFFATISLLLFVSFDALAQFSRETTFDNRDLCQSENKGIWREFGDSCVDSCESKFDKLKICDRSLQFSCDCGVARCWSNNNCLLISDYKKIYQRKLAKEQARLEKDKIARQAMAKANAEIITQKLVQEAAARAMSPDIGGASNNYGDFYGDVIAELMDSEAAKNGGKIVKQGEREIKKANNDLPPIPVAPPIVIDNGKSEIPPVFLKKQALKEKNNSSKNSQAEVPALFPVQLQ